MPWARGERQGRGDRYSRTTSWDAEGWCNLGVLCTIYVKVTLPYALAADCITLSSARRDLLLLEERCSVSWQQVLKLSNLPAAAEPVSNVFVLCVRADLSFAVWPVSICVSWQEVHWCQLWFKYFLWYTEEIYFDTCCIDKHLGCLRLLRPAALVSAAQAAEY